MEQIRPRSIVSNGNHTIATPVTLQSNLNVTVLAGDSLTISGGVSGSGESLTLNGPGKLVLGGTNGFNGGTAVLSGTLVIAGPNALANGSNLAVGTNVGSLFGAVIAAPTVGSATTNAVCIGCRVGRGRAKRRRRWRRSSAIVGPRLFRSRAVSAAQDGCSRTSPTPPDSAIHSQPRRGNCDRCCPVAQV